MKVSFVHDNEHLEFELSAESYKRLMQIIGSSRDEDEAIAFCTAEQPSQPLCPKLIRYEFSRRQKSERSLKEIDTSCDYNDHL